MQDPLGVYANQYIYKAGCDACQASGCSDGSLSAGCVFYLSGNLPISGILNKDSMEVALQKIETKLAAVAGDYSTYSLNCIAPAGTVTSEAQFVNLITSEFCTLQTQLTTFVGTTFEAYKTAVNTRFTALEVPGITATSPAVGPTDTLATVLNKYATKFSALDAALSLSGVTWSQCFTVVTAPTTIADGFNQVLGQICQLKGSVGATSLPTFNNVGSCLPTPGAADTLVDTIEKLKTRVCQSPVLDISQLSFTCVTRPTGGGNADLQGLMTQVLSKLDYLSQNLPSFAPSDFAVSQVDASSVCAGKLVKLQVGPNVDRFVAVNSNDTAPGTLMGKLVAGTGITLDDQSQAGKLVISSTGSASSADAFKVKANSSDTAPDFLDQKITGDVQLGISLTTLYDPATQKVKVSAQLRIEDIFSELMDYLETDSEAKARLCTLMASCPSPCDPPQNVQATEVLSNVVA
jgi:hypothetical protein